MKLGIDIGYNAVKAFDGIHQVVTFPSVVGTADASRFTAGGIASTKHQQIEMCDNTKWMYGDEAVEMSRMVMRPEDRSWYNTSEYHILLTAAIRDTLRDTILKKDEKLYVVTGLPVMFYDDRKELEEVFMTDHCFIQDNGHAFAYPMGGCRVIPQPFGSLIDMALDMDGDVKDAVIARGTVGVIDCGGKTTNFLTASKMREVARLTTSINMGGWDIVRAVRERLNVIYPSLDIRDSLIAESIIRGSIKIYGEYNSIQDESFKAILPFADMIVATATQLWNSGATLDRIILTGGGAQFVYNLIKSKYPHAHMVENPVVANVMGYYKFAKRIFKEVE